MANKNGTYWEKRSIDLERLVQDKTDETIKKINFLYASSFDSIENRIGEVFETFVKNSKLSKSEALKLMNTEQTAQQREDLMRLYRETDNKEVKQDILNRLNASTYASRITRLQYMQSEIFREFVRAGVEIEKHLESRMIDSYTESYYHSIYNIQKELGFKFDFNKLTHPGVKAALAHNWYGGNYSSRLWKDTVKLSHELEKIIEVGFLTGKDTKQMTFELQNKMGSGQKVTNRLVRTEVAYIAGQGRMLSYKAAGVKKYIYIAVLDLKTSLICRILDHKVFLVKEAKVGKNFPPMHPRCRSTDGAYYSKRDISNLKRAARDPKTGENILVPYSMNYAEWYKTYVVDA